MNYGQAQHFITVSYWGNTAVTIEDTVQGPDPGLKARIAQIRRKRQAEFHRTVG